MKFIIFIILLSQVNSNKYEDILKNIKINQIKQAKDNLNILEKYSYIKFHLLQYQYKNYNASEIKYIFIIKYINKEADIFESLYLFNKCVLFGYDPDYLSNFLIK